MFPRDPSKSVPNTELRDTLPRPEPLTPEQIKAYLISSVKQVLQENWKRYGSLVADLARTSIACDFAYSQWKKDSEDLMGGFGPPSREAEAKCKERIEQAAREIQYTYDVLDFLEKL